MGAMGSSEEMIARYVKVITGEQVVVCANAQHDFVSDGMMWLQTVPSDAENITRISWREENPAFMGHLMHLVSHMKSTASDDADKRWNDIEIDALNELLEQKPLLTHALKTWLMEQLEDADDGMTKGITRIGESTGLIYKEEAESILGNIDSSVEEVDIFPSCVPQEGTTAKSLGLDDGSDTAEDSSEQEDINSDEQSSNNTEQQADQGENDNAQTDNPQNQYFDESIENPFKNITEAGSEQSNEAIRKFDKSNYERASEERKTARKAKQAAKNTFPKSQLSISTRKPTADDRQLRTKLTKTLRNARWRAPDKSEVSSQVPPGRLSSRDAVLWTAQESMGLPITAEPFVQERVRTREAPPPYLGMACDISGSMGSSEKPMSSLIWAMSNAVPSVGGKFAAVSFDRQVKSLAEPGRRLRDVPLVKAEGDYEAAHQAIQSLVGGLNLLDSRKGVRVILISSDAMWRKKEIGFSKRLLKALSKSGVHILWVTFQKGLSWRTKSDAIFSEVGTVIEFESMDDIALGLGQAISRIVERS